MDFKKDSFLAFSGDYKLEFRIKNYKASSEFDAIENFVHTGDLITGVRITILGNGNLRHDKSYVLFSIKNFGDRYRHSLACACNLSILDAKGEKVIPRRFDFIFTVESENKYRYYSESYVQRSFILNNAPEYLQEDTLTVIVEGTLEEWVESDVVLSPYSVSQDYDSTFIVIESSDLEVYLRKHSIQANILKEYSTVFQDMWNVPMRESVEECVLLKNEELPAFLSMLAFLDTKVLILHKVTLYDLYKIADKYDIPILLEKCRKSIEKFLSDIMSINYNFTKPCDRKFNSEGNAEKYFKTTQGLNSNSEIGISLDDHSAFAKTPSDNSINTKEEFNEYFNTLVQEIEKNESCTLSQYWKSEVIESVREENGQFLGVYLRIDSLRAKFLVLYSGIFRKLKSAITPGSSEKLFFVSKEEAREFICMLLFIEFMELILVDITVIDMYKIAHKYDVLMLKEVCLEHIKNILPIILSDILNFAQFYDDKELERVAISYAEANSLDIQDDNSDFEHVCEMHDYHVCDILPVSSTLIQSASDFWLYLSNISKKIQNVPEVCTFKKVPSVEKCNTETELESFDFYN